MSEEIFVLTQVTNSLLRQICIPALENMLQNKQENGQKKNATPGFASDPAKSKKVSC